MARVLRTGYAVMTDSIVNEHEVQLFQRQIVPGPPPCLPQVLSLSCDGGNLGSPHQTDGIDDVGITPLINFHHVPEKKARNGTSVGTSVKYLARVLAMKLT